MLQGKNPTVFSFSRPAANRAHGKQLPPDADVRLSVRFDIEDRNFHWETKRNGGAEFHFSTNTHTLSELPAAPEQDGGGRTSNSSLPKTRFVFSPPPGRPLPVFFDTWAY